MAAWTLGLSVSPQKTKRHLGISPIKEWVECGGWDSVSLLYTSSPWHGGKIGPFSFYPQEGSLVASTLQDEKPSLVFSEIQTDWCRDKYSESCRVRNTRSQQRVTTWVFSACSIRPIGQPKQAFPVVLGRLVDGSHARDYSGTSITCIVLETLGDQLL